jgi:hypothetical protein
MAWAMRTTISPITIRITVLRQVSAGQHLFHNNQMNATIGGPIIKDKAFIFLYYEGQRYISITSWPRNVAVRNRLKRTGDKLPILAACIAYAFCCFRLL